MLSELSRRFARFALLAALMLPGAFSVTGGEAGGDSGVVEEEAG